MERDIYIYRERERERGGRDTILKAMMCCSEGPVVWTMPHEEGRRPTAMSQTQMGLVPEGFKMWLVETSTLMQKVSSV